MKKLTNRQWFVICACGLTLIVGSAAIYHSAGNAAARREFKTQILAGKEISIDAGFAGQKYFSPFQYAMRNRNSLDDFEEDQLCKGLRSRDSRSALTLIIIFHGRTDMLDCLHEMEIQHDSEEIRLEWGFYAKLLAADLDYGNPSYEAISRFLEFFRQTLTDFKSLDMDRKQIDRLIRENYEKYYGNSVEPSR